MYGTSKEGPNKIFFIVYRYIFKINVGHAYKKLTALRYAVASAQLDTFLLSSKSRTYL